MNKITKKKMGAIMMLPLIALMIATLLGTLGLIVYVFILQCGLIGFIIILMIISFIIGCYLLTRD